MDCHPKFKEKADKRNYRLYVHMKYGRYPLPQEQLLPLLRLWKIRGRDQLRHGNQKHDLQRSHNLPDMNHYVAIKKDLFTLEPILGVPAGKTRIREDGKTEAEFHCINPGSNCQTVWATKDELIPE